MDKLFIDTDVVLDILAQRHPFYTHAAHLFSLGDKGKIKLYISSVCFNNLNYLLSKQYGRNATRKILSDLKVLVTVLAVDDKIITLALNSSFSDFEDAIQYFTAIENNIRILITRNIKDYKGAEISVMSPETYLKSSQKN